MLRKGHVKIGQEKELESGRKPLFSAHYGTFCAWSVNRKLRNLKIDIAAVSTDLRATTCSEMASRHRSPVVVHLLSNTLFNSEPAKTSCGGTVDRCGKQQQCVDILPSLKGGEDVNTSTTSFGQELSFFPYDESLSFMDRQVSQQQATAYFFDRYFPEE